MKTLIICFLLFINFGIIFCVLSDDFVKDQFIQLNKKVTSYCSKNDETIFGQIYMKYTNNEVGLSKNEENLINEAIKLIQNYRNAESLDIFNQISNNDRFIKRIVSKIYANNANDVKNILKFVDSVPEIYKRYLFLWSVYENLSIRKDFKQRVNLLKSMRIIKVSPQYGNFADFDKQNLKVMINMLDILDGRTKLTDGNVNPGCQMTERPSSINGQLEILVELSKNIEEMLSDFVELKETETIERMKISEWNNQLMEYNMEYENRFSEMLKLAYKVKNLQDNEVTDENKFSAKMLQKSFLFTIQGIVWDKVCIRNTLPVTFPYYKSFLIAEENWKNGTTVIGDQEIFVLNNGGQVPIIGAEWIFEPVNDESVFYIKSGYTEKYLAASDKFYGPKTEMRMPIMTKEKVNSSEYHWKVKSDYVMFNHFRIINVKYNEELVHSTYFYFQDRNYLHIAENGHAWLIEKC